MCIVRERRPAGFLDMKCQTCLNIKICVKQVVEVCAHSTTAMGRGATFRKVKKGQLLLDPRKQHFYFLVTGLSVLQ